MAKKETVKNAPATVASKAAEKIAADVLKRNPDIKEVHVTSDGVAFYTRNDAQNHANSLENREVFGFKRAAAPATPVASSKEEADSEPERDELTGELIDDEPANTEA